MKKSGWEWMKDIACWLCAGGIMLYIAYVWMHMPDMIPVGVGTAGVSYDNRSVLRTPCVLGLLAFAWLSIVEPFLVALPIKPLDANNKPLIASCLRAALGSVRRWALVLLCVLALDRALFALGAQTVGIWAMPVGLLICAATVGGNAWRAMKLYRLPEPPREIEGEAQREDGEAAAVADEGADAQAADAQADGA